MQAGNIPPVQVWMTEILADTHRLEKQLLPLLFPSELKRLNTISHPRKRREYITSRSLIRHALKQHTDHADQPWEITEHKNSPPVATHPVKNISLSLSHSNDLIVLTATAFPTGIDIEHTKQRTNLEALSQSFMTLPEQQHFATLPVTEQPDFFYRCWCAKEALYKLHTVLGMEIIPLEKICTLSRKNSGADVHLMHDRLDSYNCQLTITTQQPFTAIEYCYVPEAELI